MTHAGARSRNALPAVVVALLLSATPASSFVLPSRDAAPSSRAATTALHFFGGLKGAFANEENSKPAQGGLTNGPRYNDQVTVNGKKIAKAVVDQKVSIVCTQARAKVSYNCNNGECGTCTVRINGRPAQACVSKVPAGKCAIKTL